jgi:hypothetical protein
MGQVGTFTGRDSPKTFSPNPYGHAVGVGGPSAGAPAAAAINHPGATPGPPLSAPSGGLRRRHIVMAGRDPMGIRLSCRGRWMLPRSFIAGGGGWHTPD